MAKLSFDLYLDESGNFENDANGHSMISLVGGLLIPSVKITSAKLDDMIKKPIHAKEYYDHEVYPGILRQLREDGGHIIIFQNEERISVINGDFTYLNIITEGIVQLLRNLRIAYPNDAVKLNILIAQRQAVAYKKDVGISPDTGERIQQDEYFNRIDEKLYIALGRKEIRHVDWQISFGVAERDKKLMLADLICFTYRFRKTNFKGKEKEFVKSLIEPEYIYSVFENAAVGTIKKLIIDQRYQEAICQICTVTDRNMISEVLDVLISRLAELSRNEIKSHLDYASIQIGQYNFAGMFRDGIAFAENYKKYILDEIEKKAPEFADCVSFARFDADFYILTMYDHVGNVAKCQQYLEVCQRNISSINRSWEHIHYYFNYCIRELNVLMGRFEFDDVMKRAGELEKILIEARDLFGMIKTYNGTEQNVRSELLGKVYGVQAEAMINLMHLNPDLFAEAENALAKGMKEFTDAYDVTRTNQWKCLLMTEAKRPDEAVQVLLQTLEVQDTEKPFDMFVKTGFAQKPHIWEFLFWQYTNVMLLLKEKADSRAEEMGRAFILHPSYKVEIENPERKGHPWNLVLWNLGRYMRLKGNQKAYVSFYNRAVSLTRADPNNVTMMTFAISMEADHLLWLRENGAKEADTAEANFIKHLKYLKNAGTTEAMNENFMIDEILGSGQAKDEILKQIRGAYLK